jgi:hypothetical protein
MDGDKRTTIQDGDLLIVDKSKKPKTGDIVIACLDGAFTVIWLDESSALLTTAAEDALGEIHHRRPVALKAEDGKTWIDTGAESASGLISRLIPASDISFHPVSPRVNSPREDGEMEKIS